MNTLYGIKNCDTVKKARRWLDERHIDYTFHDLREDGIDEDTLRQWMASLGWEALVNKRSTTWRQLDESIKTELDDSNVVELLLSNPTLIKRPVLSLSSGDHHIGFKEPEYENIFNR